MSGMSSFLLAMAVPPAVPEKTEQTKTPWRPTFRPLQPIGESSDSSTPNDQPPFASDKAMARKMEELGRIRRMQARHNDHLNRIKRVLLLNQKYGPSYRHFKKTARQTW